MRRAALAILALGCATVPLGGPRVPSCPGSLVDVSSLPDGDFLLRERARVEAPGVELALELLAERRGDRLVVVAFGPLGARVFDAVQTGRALESDSPLGRAFAIDPATLLGDLHAARFADPPDARRTTIRRPGCAHATTFVRVERRALQ